MGGGTLVCCGKDMILQEEKHADQGLEKHVPVVEKTAKGVKVTVGSVLHPMEAGHFIEWIELVTESKVYRQYLKPGDQPVAEFETNEKTVEARAFCNLHGLWKS